MGVRRIKSPTVVAWAAALVGLIGVISASTPEMADRFDFVRGVLPQGIPTAARVLTLAFSLALLWLARGLARRKRRAWQLAVALVVATAVTHLAKGLDFEEALGSLAVFAVLWRTRREFVAPGDPESVRPLVQVALAIGVIGTIVGLHLDGTVAYSDHVDDALLILIGALAARGLFLWLRPITDRARHVPAERRRAEALVQEHGSDSLAYFALRHDKSRFFSASGDSFLAYRVVGGTAVVTGDPIGDPVGAARAARGVPAGRALEGVAGRDRGRERRGAARLCGARFQVDLPRRRGIRATRQVLARRPPDPQGAPVGHPAREGRLPGRALRA